MNPNPYKPPEHVTARNETNTNAVFTTELASVMLWGNVGFVLAYLLFSGLDWLYMSWGGLHARNVNIAWSKLLFILVGANLIILFTYINRNTGSSKETAIEEQAHEKRQQ